MPTPTTVKLLVDEPAEDGQTAALGHVWDDPRAKSPVKNRRKSSGLAAFCAIAAVMFIFGVALGAAVYTYFTPGAFSELLRLVSFNGDNTSQTTPEADLDELVERQCPDFPWDELRLPDDVIPEHYNITLHPNITTGTLRGTVSIDLKVQNKTSVIVLHALRLNISSFYLNVNRRKVNVEHDECGPLQQWAFSLDKPIDEDDDVVLGIEYDGIILADFHGLYISTHYANDGRVWKSLATQFEPTHARKAFPCFDEPSMKATFQLSVVRDADLVVRSNTNLKVSREHGDGLYLDVFEKSVKMSTYLLAVAVLDNYNYDKRITKTTQKPIEVRLYASRDVLKGNSEFGLTVAVRALEYFEDFFNISYPLDKIDLLALDDFAEGAMENWGLATFRDSTLLFNEDTCNAASKEHIALVVCHEIAHQWFGNLVTMHWWNDLWLNEGFANFMEFKCVDHIFPEWSIMTRFYAENAGHAMEPDGFETSRPISANLASNSTNVMALFDAISYHKAAAIIHMLQELTGEWYFQKALVEYLNKYMYANAKGEELWRIVEKHASLPHGISVSSIAKQYTTQVGYPLIQIGLVNNNEEILVHNQTRFLFVDKDDDDDVNVTKSKDDKNDEGDDDDDADDDDEEETEEKEDEKYSKNGKKVHKNKKNNKSEKEEKKIKNKESKRNGDENRDDGDNDNEDNEDDEDDDKDTKTKIMNADDADDADDDNDENDDDDGKSEEVKTTLKPKNRRRKNRATKDKQDDKNDTAEDSDNQDDDDDDNKNDSDNSGDDDDDNEENDDEEWIVPVYIRTDSKKEPQLKWLRPEEQKVHWRIDEPAKWIIANTGGRGYFKVLYDKPIYRELIKQLHKNHNEISPIDRAMLLTDAYEFTKVGKLDVATYLDLVQYAADERDKTVWTVLARHLKAVEALMEESSAAMLFRDFQKSLIIRVYDEVGWKEDPKSHTERGLQQEIVALACRLGHADCPKRAATKFNQWIVSKKRLSPELQGIVFEEGIKNGDSATWEKALAAFSSSRSPMEKQQIITGLASSKDARLIQKLLRLTLDGKTIKANTLPRVFASLAENELSRSAAWRFFRIHYDEFAELLGEGSNLLLAAIRGLVERTSTTHDLAELREFLDSKKLDQNQSKLKQLYDTIDVNIQWREVNEEALEKYLNQWDDRRRRLDRRRHLAKRS